MSRSQQVQPGGTAQLDKATRAYRAAEQRLATAILEAHEAGSSLRTIASATRYSHEKIRAVLVKERRRIAYVEERIARGPVGLSFDAIERKKATLRRLAKSLPVRNPDG